MHKEYSEPLKKKVDAVPDELIAKKLIECRGLQYIAARSLGMAKSTICERVKDSPYLQEVIAECVEHRLDMAEQSLSKLIEAKDSELGAICFLLKTKGKKRGYQETVQHEVDPEAIANSRAISEQLKEAREVLAKKLDNL